MNSKHRKTLADIFAIPINGNLEWPRIESLLVVLGCIVVEGKGSAVTFVKDGRKLNIHRPHTSKEALKYRIRLVREFLQQMEIEP